MSTYPDRFSSSAGTARRSRVKFPGNVETAWLDRYLSPKYYAHLERFEQLPGLSTDHVSTLTSPSLFATLRALNNDYEVTAGTNGTTALATAHASGGLTLTTATGSADTMIVQARSLAKASGLRTTFDPAKEPQFGIAIETGAAVTTTNIWAGFKLTSVPAVATDDDQAYFRFAAAEDDGVWQAVTSVGGTDVEAVSTVTVAASTLYRLFIDVDADRVPRYYINDALVATGAALTAEAAIIPCFGVQTVTTAARAITVRNVYTSQRY